MQKDLYNNGGITRWYWDYRDRRVLKLVPGGKVLDVGCGEMITTHKIPGAIGMDLDQGDVRGSVYKIPFPDNSFDAVTLLDVIEHLDHPVTALKEIKRVLRPGGKLILMFPNDTAFFLARMICGKWTEAFMDYGHMRQYTPMFTRELMKVAGYKVIKSRRIPFGLWPISLHCIVVGEK
ncbi:MAG: class I SAM-dependent methyltransferase [Syntrophorhabdaceae bacterium]|nr:class I SAM-dependent methyltransferase [Syntrophorhabdaceae bacterium]